MIKLENICVNIGDGPEILCDVSGVFEDGKLTCIIGPNGAGKTTLLRTCAGLQNANSGQVYIGDGPETCAAKTPAIEFAPTSNGTSNGDGPENSAETWAQKSTQQLVNLSTLSNRQRAKLVSILPQSRTVPNIAARSLVLHARFPYLGYPRKYTLADFNAADEALACMDAASLATRNLQELSGGERQKVYLSMLLAQSTQNLLLDEPTTYLDISHQFDALETLAHTAHTQNKCVVCVLHDICLAATFADSIFVLDRGFAKFAGSVKNALDSKIIDDAFNVRLNKVANTSCAAYYITKQRNVT